MQRFGIFPQKKCCTKFFPLAQSIFPYFLCQATFLLPLHLFLHSLARMAVDPRNCPTLGLSTKKKEKTLSRPTIYPFTTCHIPAPLLWQIEGRVHAAADPNISLHFTYHRHGGVTEYNNKLLEARRTYTWRTINFVIHF